MYHIGASDAPLWAEKVREMTERIKALGPNPLNVVRQNRSISEPGDKDDSSQAETLS